MQQRPDDGVGAPHATCPSLQVMATSTTEQLHVACTACRLPRSAPARGRRGPGDCWDVLRHTAHHSCLVDIAFLWQATTDSIAKWRSSDEATLVLSHQGVFRRIYDILIRSEGIREEQVHRPKELPTREQLQLVKCIAGRTGRSGKLSENVIRRIGFGHVTKQPVLIERTKAEVAGRYVHALHPVECVSCGIVGTLLTAELALKHGLACNTAGGTHHAFPSYGSGFCIINDMAIASKMLLRSGRVSRILILDLDVHQGDGTACIFADNPSVFTLSVHCQSNFPCKKQKSTLDLGLPDGTGDDAYLNVLAQTLPQVLRSFRPDLVFYDAGVDPHESDVLGRLSLTDNGLYRREMMVIDTCLSTGVPVACLVGGGYDKNVDRLAQRHCLVHRAASELWKDHRL